MIDEGLLQQAAGMVDSPQTSVAAASHLLADSAHLGNQGMQRSVEPRHAQKRISVRLSHNLPQHTLVKQSAQVAQTGLIRSGSICKTSLSDCGIT